MSLPSEEIYGSERRPLLSSSSLSHDQSPSSQGGNASPLQADDSIYNINGFDQPLSDRTKAGEPEEEESIYGDVEPHRGVKRDLTQWQIFVGSWYAKQHIFRVPD